jgi:hypothetical protein
LQQEYDHIGNQQIARDRGQIKRHRMVSGRSAASVATAARSRQR